MDEQQEIKILYSETNKCPAEVKKLINSDWNWCLNSQYAAYMISYTFRIKLDRNGII